MCFKKIIKFANVSVWNNHITFLFKSLILIHIFKPHYLCCVLNVFHWMYNIYVYKNYLLKKEKK